MKQMFEGIPESYAVRFITTGKTNVDRLYHHFAGMVKTILMAEGYATFDGIEIEYEGLALCRRDGGKKVEVRTCDDEDQNGMILIDATYDGREAYFIAATDNDWLLMVLMANAPSAPVEPNREVTAG
jgi:hypothetical protein